MQSTAPQSPVNTCAWPACPLTLYIIIGAIWAHWYVDRTCAGLEPHSVLPVAVPAIMNTHSGVLPAPCNNCHSLATSAAFSVPFARHVWWWLNIRPATRQTFEHLLQQGKTVCVTPGGVQECLYMAPGHEIAFLKKRLGFIRLALRHGYATLPHCVVCQTCSCLTPRPSGAAMHRRLMPWC
jgi:diacylglycerol O-acyltransferase 2, plant